MLEEEPNNSDPPACNAFQNYEGTGQWFLSSKYAPTSRSPNNSVQYCKQNAASYWDKTCDVKGTKATIGSATKPIEHADLNLGIVTSPITFRSNASNDAYCCSCSRMTVDKNKFSPGSTNCIYNVEPSKLIGKKIWSVEQLCSEGDDPVIPSGSFPGNGNLCPIQQYCGWGCGGTNGSRRPDLKAIEFPGGVKLEVWGPDMKKKLFEEECSNPPCSYNSSNAHEDVRMRFSAMTGYKVGTGVEGPGW